MVGVPGKFKGCETCRLRRVKCDNARPFCKKCLDSGRECAGYSRETVFIIGTVEDGGRCSSHPPRVVKSKKSHASSSSSSQASSSKSPEMPSNIELLPRQPLQAAWDDLLAVVDGTSTYQVRVAALHTPLHTVRRKHDELGSRQFTLSFPAYMSADVRPPMREEDFQLRCHCLVHLAPVDEMQIQDSEATTTDSICLFLYEQNSSVFVSSLPPWKEPTVQSNNVRQLGPEQFREFPAHHFFVRVFRHSAICAALLNRKSSFLSSPEWIAAPWEFHPKSWFDKLLDVVALLPSVFSRADRIIPHEPTLARRLMAQDLLGNCLNVEAKLEEWHQTINPPQLGPIPHRAFWIEDAEGSDAQIPFADTFAFRDSVTAVMFLYFWATLVLFYPCIERINDCIFQPVVDSFPQVFPNLPSGLHINTLKYSSKEVRELAAHVCRGLDFALNTTVQPDLLVFPLHVVEEFYKEINISSGDGALEIMWCEAFKTRLTSKGQDIADVVQSREWMDLWKF